MSMDRKLTREEQSDPVAVALVALEMEQNSTNEFERNGMMFQRLVLPSIMDAMNRVIPKVGKAQALAAVPAYIAPVIVAVVSEVFYRCSADNRREAVNDLVRQLSDSVRVHCASTFAQFDGLDPDVMASAERDRIQAERADPGADRVDAEPWRAFLASGRIKLWGWAGFNDAPGDDRGYRHFGGEFWSTYSAENLTAEQEQTRVRLNEQAREILTQYADALRARKGGQ